MKKETLRLWKVNYPIKKALNADGRLAFAVGAEQINALVQRLPDKYLAELEFWHRALRNQCFYKLEGNNVDVACIGKRNDGTLSTVCFRCVYDGKWLLVEAVDESVNCFRAGNWIDVKSDSRKKRGH